MQTILYQNPWFWGSRSRADPPKSGRRSQQIWTCWRAMRFWSNLPRSCGGPCGTYVGAIRNDAKIQAFFLRSHTPAFFFYTQLWLDILIWDFGSFNASGVLFGDLFHAMVKFLKHHFHSFSLLECPLRFAMFSVRHLDNPRDGLEVGKLSIFSRSVGG